MSIVLRRVDERLIHGQVVIGWGNQMRFDRYIVVDDELAGSRWEQDLYRLGLLEGIEVDFCTVAVARSRLEEWRADAVPSILLTRDLETMVRLAEGGTLAGESVNLGGIHSSPGRDMVLPYLYLDAHLRALLQHLEEEGVEVSAQDLPGSPRVHLNTLLATGERR
jgi:PTS system mannose-specific IIB component/fructoselysine and glucoselysine-specific PTS system IIB component